MGKKNALKAISPEQVQKLLNTHKTQAEVARHLNVGQGSLSLYMKRHGFVKVERWERQGVQS